MRDESNPNVEERDAARTLRIWVDICIWTNGFLDLVVYAYIGLVICISCRTKQDQVRFLYMHETRIPKARMFIQAHAKKINSNDPLMKEGCVICAQDF